jgi:hypothetical protein
MRVDPTKRPARARAGPCNTRSASCKQRADAAVNKWADRSRRRASKTRETSRKSMVPRCPAWGTQSVSLDGRRDKPRGPTKPIPRTRTTALDSSFATSTIDPYANAVFAPPNAALSFSARFTWCGRGALPAAGSAGHPGRAPTKRRVGGTEPSAMHKSDVMSSRTPAAPCACPNMLLQALARGGCGRGPNERSMAIHSARSFVAVPVA